MAPQNLHLYSKTILNGLKIFLALFRREYSLHKMYFLSHFLSPGLLSLQDFETWKLAEWLKFHSFLVEFKILITELWLSPMSYGYLIGDCTVD